MRVSHEHVRGCGFRKPGGLYLVAAGVMRECGRLPIALSVCPTCHSGIKPTRGWTWVDGDALLMTAPCNKAFNCWSCPLNEKVGRVGLLWIGEQFYRSPQDWLREARVQGVSRRIKAVPRDFKLGETWVFVAHRRVMQPAAWADSLELQPGVFHVFKPEAIEYVVKGTETDAELAKLEERGITPVKVVPIRDELPLLVDAG